MVSKWLFGMNYLVNLQTSKAKHCTARCRGNPSGTFAVTVWGWRTFQTGSSRAAEQTWPKGRQLASIKLVFLQQPRAFSLSGLRWASSRPRRGLALDGGVPPAAEECQGVPASAQLHLCRLSGIQTCQGPACPIQHPTQLPAFAPCPLHSNARKVQALVCVCVCVRIRKRRTSGNVFSLIRPARAFLFLPAFFKPALRWNLRPFQTVSSVIDTYVNGLFLCKVAPQISNTNTLCRSDVRYKNGLLIEIIEALFWFALTWWLIYRFLSHWFLLVRAEGNDEISWKFPFVLIRNPTRTLYINTFLLSRFLSFPLIFSWFLSVFLPFFFFPPFSLSPSLQISSSTPIPLLSFWWDLPDLFSVPLVWCVYVYIFYLLYICFQFALSMSCNRQ